MKHIALLLTLTSFSFSQDSVLINDKGQFVEICSYFNESDSTEINTSLIRKTAISSVTKISRNEQPLIRITTIERTGLMTDKGGDAMYFIVVKSNEVADKIYKEINASLNK